MVQCRRMLALDILFEQSECTTQGIRRRFALVSGHAVDFEFELQMRCAGLLRILIEPNHGICCDRLRNAFDLHVAALLTAHFVLHKRISLNEISTPPGGASCSSREARFTVPPTIV